MAAPLNLALAQTPANLIGVEARMAWLGDALGEICREGADLVVLPELFACGYNIGEGVRALAEPRDGPAFHEMARLARMYEVALHYGYAERAENTLFNASQTVSPTGERLSHHRKLAIPPGAERQFFSPGTGCDLFAYKGLRIASLICYDAEFPELVRHVAGLGAQLVLVPTALGKDWLWVAERMMPTRAYENGVYLAYANSAGEENGMQFLGHSVIAAPNGVELARAGAAPTVLYAQIDATRVRAAQERLPYLEDRQSLRP